ncbi:tyrosine-type recombinase/integrase [Hyphomicrobium sp. LHD-15]|uniref:tyrosine-type recombinase/integrase n=1 Tax=Hyphomicrobium sp. LHD-15 TaxID=3072142 RepID=UPI00280DE298|nr:tyrosine-type recombinase/integrase [Hyphomicrobium sp. LHD-15]MDQ8700581.1 tyrosine-type recombinase/integrase [Hyphomicrobium sp. LHD-15]
MITVKIPYVHEDVDRHGNVRIYFWRKGQRKIRIREAPGTEGFEKRYRELLAESEAGKLAPSDSAPGRIAPGTWRWLCVEYFKSSEFKSLDPTTQRPRRGILESTFDEILFPGSDETFASFPLARMTSKSIRVLRDRKRKTPTAANGRVKAINGVFNWALAQDPPLAQTNPARDVPKLATPSGGHHTWTVDEVSQFEEHHPIGTMARLALAIFLFTGIRRSDAVRLGRQHARDGWFKFRQWKNRNRHPVDIEIPILPELEEIIRQSPTGDLTYIVTTYGMPFADAGFGNKFREWCDEAGLPQCSAHGLRKAGATLAAENGATVHQLMSIFGWLTLKEAERYTRAAERKRLAKSGMHLLVRGKE